MECAALKYNQREVEQQGKDDEMDFKDLTEEQMAKARACKTPEEILELAKEEGYELSDEELDGVSGGWCLTDQKGCPDRCGCLCPRV